MITWLDYIILQMCTLNDSHMMYGSWDMECNRQNFLSFWTIFCPFSPNNPKNQNFEKMKKTPGDIIILNKCTTNDNHMMHSSWDKKCDKQNFLSLFTIFCPFTPLIKNFEKVKKKKSLEISFYIRVPKIMIRWCTFPEIWCVTDIIVISHFGLFFALLQPEKSKFW